MADTVQIGDLVQALSHARATFAGQVGTGSTTTVINLEGLDLGSESLVGNFVLLDAGALGAGSTPQVASITANTDKSITVGALPIAPATGANIWIYQVATINANVSENIQQVGGSLLPTGQSGNPNLPTTTDGNNLLSDVVAPTVIANQIAATDFAVFTPKFSGTATAMIELATSSTLSLGIYPQGGATEYTAAVLSGSSISAQQWTSFSFPVQQGSKYALQLGTAQVGNLVVHVQVEGN